MSNWFAEEMTESLINGMATIKYMITETELIIKTCMFKTVLKLDKITEVKQAKGIYSFTASSREQLKLKYTDNKIIGISPQNLSGFWESLDLHIKKQSESENSI